MADYLKGLFGAQKPDPSPSSDDDFADFAGAPDPSPASISPATPLAATAQGAVPTSGSQVVYTKWYRVWERTSRQDFISEAIILPFIILIIAFHVWGRRANKQKAKGWMTAHVPLLQKEYAQVGFKARKASTVDDTQKSELELSEDIMKEQSASEYLTYATGRQNVAFMDIRLQLYKRYNPGTLSIEYFLSFLFDTFKKPVERMEATAYSFDGREKDLVPPRSQEQKDAIEAQAKSRSSTYDPFVWAVVHKDIMRTLRDERYDLSITSTRDQAKLPAWATVMSESAEITEQLLTPELIKAVESAGDAFEFLIVTDQPLDKPQQLDETKPRKRLSLSLRLPSSPTSSATLPIFTYFLRLPDLLAQHAHFRPEVMRKVRAIRDEEQRKLVKASEEEKAEERRLEGEKKKKEIRDGRLKGMSADEQRKFLERERGKEKKKGEKRMSKKG